MNLYVDGAKVGHNGQTNNQSYTGYWRVGGDNLGGWPDTGSNFFAGSIDETAVYDHALNLAAVQSHYAASGRTPPPSNVPPDNYGKAIYSDNPANYWRLDETGGATTAADSHRQQQHRQLRGRRHAGAGRCARQHRARGHLRRQHGQRRLDQPAVGRARSPGAVVPHHDHERRQAHRLRRPADRVERQLRQARLHDRTTAG